MGNVLVSLDDADERLLRRLAKSRYGGRRGAIQKIVTEGLREVESKDGRKAAVRRLLSSMEEGLNFGLKGDEKPYRSRDELYD